MNRKLLMAIVILMLCCGVAAGVIATVNTIRDRNNNPANVTDPSGQTDPTGNSQTGQSGTNDPNGQGQSGTNTPGGSGTGSQTGENDPSGQGQSQGNTPSGSGDTTNDNPRNAQEGDVIKSYLFIGVDEDGDIANPMYYRGNNRADALLLVVVNETAKTYAAIQIDRDTVCELDVLDAAGKPYSSKTDRICFAYWMGDGTEKSAENTVRAVSRLLGGVDIDGYIAVTYNAIPVLNDTIGGIKVEIEDDLTPVNASLVKGTTVELTGSQALSFIRARVGVGDGTNTSRMRRQRTYLDAFRTRLFAELKTNSKIVDDLFNAAKPYMVTDMSASALTKVAINTTRYANLGIVRPTGTLVPVHDKDDGSDYSKFYPATESLRELVRSLYGNVSF